MPKFSVCLSHRSQGIRSYGGSVGKAPSRPINGQHESPAPSSSKNRAHVPKFGDWNNQSQPFTAVFDNARTNKRADLYESLENSDIKTQAKPPPQQPTPIIPKPVRAPPPTDINKVRAPPANQLYGARGGLYGGYGGGGGSGNQRQPQVPPRPPQTQPKPNVRGGNNGRGGTTIPPFPGSVGSGDQNMSYTHIFDQVKEERRDARSNGGSVGNTPSRLINDDQRSRDQSTAPGSFKESDLCCQQRWSNHYT
ncbi:hypothetical protein YC2023_068504 [Brassica napus]